MTIAASFCGNVGQDPELRFTGNGLGVLSFSVATRAYDKKEGEQTTWVRCTVFGKRAETLGAHLKKGSSVFVRGSLKLNEYQTKDGEHKASLEVVVDDLEYVGGGKGEGAPAPRGASGGRRAPASPPVQVPGATRPYGSGAPYGGNPGGHGQRENLDSEPVGGGAPADGGTFSSDDDIPFVGTESRYHWRP